LTDLVLRQQVRQRDVGDARAEPFFQLPEFLSRGDLRQLVDPLLHHAELVLELKRQVQATLRIFLKAAIPFFGRNDLDFRGHQGGGRAVIWFWAEQGMVGDILRRAVLSYPIACPDIPAADRRMVNKSGGAGTSYNPATPNMR